MNIKKFLFLSLFGLKITAMPSDQPGKPQKIFYAWLKLEKRKPGGVAFSIPKDQQPYKQPDKPIR